MYQVGETLSGNILVEMTPHEWEAVTNLFRTSTGFTVSLGDELVRYRHSKGLTQAQAAQLLGISKSYVSRIERGVAGNISSEIQHRIIAIIQ